MTEPGNIEFSAQNSNPEQDIQTLEQKLKASDPRDYLKDTTFQKHARAIDPNPDHPWEKVFGDFIWSNDAGYEITVSTIPDANYEKRNLLMATKSNNNEIATAYLTNLEPSVGIFAYDIIGQVTRRFPVKERFAFIQNLIKAYPELINLPPDQASFRIAMLAIDLLPDYPNATPLDKKVDLPRVSYGEPKPSAQQRSDLQSFLEKLSAKMPPDEFQEKLDEFTKIIPFTDHIYGKNFKYIFSDGIGWAISSRSDTQINNFNSDPKTTDKALTFPVKDLIKRKINSDEELRNILAEMPVKPEPDVRHLKRGPDIVEFVDLERLVGGPGIDSWAVVSETPGRGFENIKKFVDGFTTGTIDVSGQSEPMGVIEVGGFYFINKGGRHRAAAMKALGIPFAPMIVAHIK